jgi:hypothetical protein
MIITVSPSRPILSHDLLGPPRQAQDSEEPRSLGTMLWFAIRGLGQADANTSRMATEDCHEPHGCHAALAHVLERALPTKWRHPEIRPVSPRPLIGLGAKPISSRFAILFVLRPVPSSHAQATRPKTQDPRLQRNRQATEEREVKCHQGRSDGNVHRSLAMLAAMPESKKTPISLSLWP